MARVIEQAGVSVAPTGSTGVQVNEFEAAIKSVTSSTTVGAVFVYDTRNDSDSGAWRKKARGSWYYEDLNTATRGGRREFPSVALIVADNGDPDGTARTITIYDLDDPAMPMWMVFQADSNDGSKFIWNNAAADATGIAALNGQVYISVAGGGWDKLIKFADDELVNVVGAASPGSRISGPIANRNATGYTSWGDIPAYWINQIVNSTSNDCAMKVLEGAEIGALGLPIPTVGVATNGGVSVIHPNGSVYDQTDTISSNNQSYDVFWDDKGGLFFGSRGISSASTYLAYERNTLYADKSTSASYAYAPSGATLSNKIIFLGSGGPYINGATKAGDNIAIGSSQGLSLIKHNDGNPDEGMISYHTSDYCTGYMLGDIRFAGLANAASADRSVKGNTLNHNGSVLNQDVATNAELQAYSGFSASNYLSRASDTDFDFGTGDFSVMLWIKSTASGSHEDLIARADTTGAEAGDWLISKVAADDYQFYRNNGSSWVGIVTSTVGADNTWQQVVVCRRGSSVEIYVNGKLSASASFSDSLTPSGGSALSIGRRLDSSAPATSASLSLLRISATAPTPQQVKDIYEAEKPLFRAGAKCLLAANQVNDLAYDSSTDLLHVASESTSSSKSFRGLEAVESLTSDGSFGLAASKPLDYVAASGGVVVGVGGDTSDADTSGCGVNLPAIDVRGDLNTADSKLPDDGKIHFTGVTTDATVTTIGQIPVAANEVCNVKVRVNGCKYNASDSSYRLNGEINQSFSRNMTGNLVEESEGMKLVESDAASTDIDLVADTSAQTIQIKVTGISATRMVWKATVEVQRISERSYER